MWIHWTGGRKMLEDSSYWCHWLLYILQFLWHWHLPNEFGVDEPWESWPANVHISSQKSRKAWCSWRKIHTWSANIMRRLHRPTTTRTWNTWFHSSSNSFVKFQILSMSRVVKWMWGSMMVILSPRTQTLAMLDDVKYAFVWWWMIDMAVKLLFVICIIVKEEIRD